MTTDRKIIQKKGIRKKHIPFILVGFTFILLILWILFGDHTKKLNIDIASLNISNVEQGKFSDYTMLIAQAQPKSIVQLSPLEGGIVQEKVIEEGTIVKEGDIILRLSNTTLILDILNSEASLAEKENMLRNTRVTMEQEKLSLQQENAVLSLEVNRKKRKMEQYERLYNEKLVSHEEDIQAKEDYDLAKEKIRLVGERQIQDSIYRAIQIDNMEASLKSMKKNMSLTYDRLENLNVKSPISGQLGSIDVVLGQSISSGTKLGQINDLSSYKVVAEIDEHYIDRISVGLEGSFNRDNSIFTVQVNKVYPEVKEGKFKVDLLFVDKTPEKIRSGQTYNVNLEMGLSEESIYIRRGSFYNQTGGNWIFVLDKEDKTAVRRKIKIGKQNPLYYQVVEGLDAGERVITSSYENFGDNEKLIIK